MAYNSIEEEGLELRTELRRFISGFPGLTSDELEELVSNIDVRLFKKGEALVKEGDISSECYFVLRGCLRQYVVIEGVEKTTRFYTEGEAAVLFTSYLSQSKSECYLCCVEESALIVGNPHEEAAMYEKFPKLQQMTRVMMEQDLGKTQDALSYFIASSPEERYLNLLQTRPDLFQRVPQHQLASYIGVSPESLSRIRKRIQRNR